MLNDCEKGSDRPGEDCLSGVISSEDVGIEFHCVCEFIVHREIVIDEVPSEFTLLLIFVEEFFHMG